MDVTVVSAQMLSTARERYTYVVTAFHEVQCAAYSTRSAVQEVSMTYVFPVCLCAYVNEVTFSTAASAAIGSSSSSSSVKYLH